MPTPASTPLRPSIARDHARQRLHRGDRIAGAALRVMPWAVLLIPCLARAQAGPPMITNDPDTPGPGAWEINIAATGARSGGSWDLDAPDLDINHGVGEHVQLSLHASWAHRHDVGDGWVAGAGPVELGVRWRFVDQGRGPVSVAVQPLWIRSYSRAAQRHGLASPDAEFVLPLQVAHRFAHAAIGAELARHFVSHDADTWQGGVYAEYDCAASVECLAEINTTWDGGARAILNLGARRALTPHFNLMGSLGRQFTGPAADRAQVVFYVGGQLVY